jgi:hypothetical protein
MIILIGFPYIHDDCLLALEKMVTLDLLLHFYCKIFYTNKWEPCGFLAVIEDFDRVAHYPLFCLYW